MVPFSLPSFPFSPETPVTQANSSLVLTRNIYIVIKSQKKTLVAFSIVGFVGRDESQ